MEITITAKFWRKFFQYLLIGFSAITLLAVSQSAIVGEFHRGPNSVWAQSAEGTLSDDDTLTEVGSGTIGQPTSASTAPAPQRTMISSGGECVNGRMHWVNRFSDGVVDTDPTANEYCTGSETNAQIIPAPVQPGPASQPQVCEWQNKHYREPQYNKPGNPMCTVYQHTCSGGYAWFECDSSVTPPSPAPVPSVVPAPVQQPITSCPSGTTLINNICQPKIVCPAETNYVNGICQPKVVPAQGEPGQSSPTSCPAGTIFVDGSCQRTGICRVCDNGNWRPGGNNPMTIVQCSRVSNSVFDQPEKPTWCQASQQPPIPPAPVCRSITCPAAPAGCGYSNQIINTCDASVNLTCGTIVCNPGVTPPVVINPAPITITNNPVNTNTVTVNNPAPVTFGNVGVGTTVYTQAIQATQLPKTGLPALAWSALAFIPAGFKMRRFSKVKGQLENHPSYIWEDRQFRSGS